MQQHHWQDLKQLPKLCAKNNFAMLHTEIQADTARQNSVMMVAKQQPASVTLFLSAVMLHMNRMTVISDLPCCRLG